VKWKEVFDEWYEEYFACSQGEDSPYTYNDVVAAFKAGMKKDKQTDISKEEKE
jgi:hypothetical protein